MSDRFQFVWWWDEPACWGWGLHRFSGGIATVYKWSLSIGPLEIRRWNRRKAAWERSRYTVGALS